MEMKKIRGAIARGWTYPVNREKIMDTDLADAISIEVQKLVLVEQIIIIERALQASVAKEAKLRAESEEINAYYEQAIANAQSNSE